jgi:hypothetical protein
MSSAMTRLELYPPLPSRTKALDWFVKPLESNSPKDICFLAGNMDVTHAQRWDRRSVQLFGIYWGLHHDQQVWEEYLHPEHATAVEDGPIPRYQVGRMHRSGLLLGAAEAAQEAAKAFYSAHDAAKKLDVQENTYRFDEFTAALKRARAAAEKAIAIDAQAQATVDAWLKSEAALAEETAEVEKFRALCRESMDAALAGC